MPIPFRLDHAIARLSPATAGGPPGRRRRPENVRAHEPEPPTRQRRGVKAVFSSLLDRCLARLPELRARSAADAAETSRAVARD